MAISGKGMQNKNGVVFIGGEFTPSFKGNTDMRQRAPAFEVKWAKVSKMAIANWVTIAPCASDGGFSGNGTHLLISYKA
jgi:hypothetical protein